MPRKRTTTERGGPLCVIDPNAVYSIAGAQSALGLSTTTVRREYREGRLRVSSRAGKRFVLGSWLLEWLAGGELPRQTPIPARNGTHNN